MDLGDPGSEKISDAAKLRASGGTAAGVIVLLLLFGALSVTATLQKSPTVDESFHVAAGYSYLRWRDFRINPEHPPLVKVLAALPLLSLDLDDAPLSRDVRDRAQVDGMEGWRAATEWLFSSNDADLILFYAKWPMIAFAATLGLLIFCWTRELYGSTAGLAALSLYVFDPNILANSAIVHTDLPFALTFFGGSYFFWRTLREITWFNWSMTAVFFALSAVTKFSFVVIMPIWGLLGFLHILSRKPIQCRIAFLSEITGSWRKATWLATFLGSAILLAYVTIWLAYGFRYDAVAGQLEPLKLSSTAAPSSWLMPWIDAGANLRLLPEAWLYGLIYALSTLKRTAYLLGEISTEGFWLYFPIAFAVKTPLPTLLLLLAGLFCLLDKRPFNDDGKFLLVPALLYMGFAVASHINIGFRHILPIYPFLFVWLGGTIGVLLSSESAVKRYSVLLLVLWLVGSSFKAYPHYLAFFNETISPRDRHRVLVESNLDWGQELKGLKRWMDEHGVKKIRLAYFGTADPAYYGIDAIYQPGTLSALFTHDLRKEDNAVSPYLAISATHLVGVYFSPRNPYERFLYAEPVAVIGGSIYIYRIDD